MIIIALQTVLYEADLDFNSSKPLSFVVKQGDTARSIKFNLLADGKDYVIPYQSENFRVFLKQKFANDAIYISHFNSKECQATESTITLPLSSVMLGIVGTALCELCICDVAIEDLDNVDISKLQKITSQTFYLEICEAIGADNKTMDVIPMLETLQEIIREEKGYIDNNGIKHPSRTEQIKSIQTKIDELSTTGVPQQGITFADTKDIIKYWRDSLTNNDIKENVT